MLRSSRTALSIFLEQLGSGELVDFCRQFEMLARTSFSNERLVVPFLETLVFLVESNVFSEASSDGFQ